MFIQLPSLNETHMTYYDQQTRDVLLILPGGGYRYASDREAEPVAHAFRDLNMHMMIYKYRHTCLTYPHILDEALIVLKQLKADPLVNRIHVIGFSAGGHFALMLLETFSEYFSSGILCYPVVSSRKDIYHGDSFKALLGKHYTEDMLKKVSLENHVHDKMPPIFLFHTMDDAIVPVDNSLVLIKALQQCHVPVESHLFPSGRHGLSVVTEETPFDPQSVETYLKENKHLHAWVTLAKSFLERYAS